MIRQVSAPLLVCLLAGWAAAQSSKKFMDPEVYCVDLDENEFFRRDYGIPEDAPNEYKKACSDYYRCVPAPGAGKFSITKSRCSNEQNFDVDRQLCDIKRNVKNCEILFKSKLPRPKWPLREGVVNPCGPGEIQCGSEECLPRELFCDDNYDCLDGSDENICRHRMDPNGAYKCSPTECKWDDGCFCSIDGTRIPGDLEVSKTPQMITITFTGAINERNFRTFQEIFKGNVRHKGNDCSPKGTFFVSHAFTNYSAVQELHRQGHEIGVSSITNNPNPRYWSNLTSDEYSQEMDGARTIIETFANVTTKDVLGMRVPKQRVGGNHQFKMMVDWGFLYDSSISAPRGRMPIWPYTLMHEIPHKCLGTDQNCPSKNFTVWEMVLNEMDRREDPEFDELLTGCHYLDQCVNLLTPEQLYRFLEHNLAHHYTTNRAPLGIHITSGYFEDKRGFLRSFARWVKDKAANGDYYFVTMQQAINWMEAPTEIAALNNFQEWKTKCDVKGLPYCSLPNPCPTISRDFPEEDNMYLYTCEECPQTYPWLNNPFGVSDFDHLSLNF